MSSLLNKSRPPVFCPGCSHERVAHALDKAFLNMNIQGDQIVMVSDIGCSGLFDTFFNTHAFHGLHGRALTYAAGLKLSRPELNVVVTMGDGGLGIGGAHLLAACRRNLNLTLLVLNNFNFGMTGGQCSATTPTEAQVGSGFLNQLERPLDVCEVASAAGIAYAARCSSYRKDLAQEIEKAIRFNGFSLIDMWGICPGRFTKRNKLTPKDIDKSISDLAPKKGVVSGNVRKEYSQHYKELAESRKSVNAPVTIEASLIPLNTARQEVIILGSAGQRIVTAGEILCLAGLSAGLNATQKNDYPITVLRGHSISELVLSSEEIGFTGILNPDVIVALSQEGVERRKNFFDTLNEKTLILQLPEVKIPSCKAKVMNIDFKAQGIKSQDRALASLSILAKLNKVISLEMLQSALKVRFKEPALSISLDLVDQVETDSL
ncbi:MAG: thiamine pyrophosphate-dependent enzyme [Desulfobacterales bacterium]|nr:thiamine pyrophosphate-dependent enzyme [Desulfobacterales bacterium]MDX2508862.1 thiamine pyrophosphate-dependent enzyme [Desulfobacterales bacterium]